MARDDWDDGVILEEEERPRARPFVVTQGKTTTKADIRLETLVEIANPASTDRFERGAVLDMTRDKSISVAELSAHLKLPIGTMVTLVGQMVDDGLLSAHAMVNSATSSSTTDNIDIMTRIINRVREL